MKKIFFFLFVQMFVLNGFAQENKALIVDRDSVLSVLSNRLEKIDFRMLMIKHLDRYKLYPTENIYTFLKLDTMTGCIELLQWSFDRENEGCWIINDVDLFEGAEYPGVFELYPTKNMYQFILLNKATGNSWHVQWGTKSTERWIRPIYSNLNYYMY